MPPTTASGGKGRGVAHPVRKGTGKGKGGVAGKSTSGKNIFGGKRHRKIPKDMIRGISKPDIRRLARRGGVKRISATIYNDARQALKERLELILRDCIAYVEYRRAKTVTVNDVIHSLARLGRPIYGFDPDTYSDQAAKNHRKTMRSLQRQNGGDEVDDDE